MNGENESQNGESQSTATETPESTSPSGEAPGQPTSVDPSTGGQTDFQHPSLKGKNPDEIERMFGIMESAVREQGSELNKLQRQVAEVSDRQRKSEPEEEVDFYADPQTAMRKVVKDTFDEMMAPFVDDLRGRRAQTARQQMRAKYDDWDEVEPYVDLMIRRQGLEENAENPALLETLYYTAVGLMAKQEGRQPRSQEQPQPAEPGQPQRRQPMAPPQHRPSNAPVAPPPDQSKTRQLTESEKALAREWNMSPEEYVAWQDAEATEVAGSNIGQEGWNE